MPGMTAVVYERLRGFVFLSEFNQLCLIRRVSFPEMSAKPALAFMKVLHGILPWVESARAYTVSEAYGWTSARSGRVKLDPWLRCVKFAGAVRSSAIGSATPTM